MRYVAMMIAAAALLSSSVAQGAQISGLPLVVDGDTIEIGTVKIRLEGIDAPETDQICLDQNAATWTCGIVARDRLAEHVGKRSIDCNPRGADKYARTLAVCSIDGEDLNAWMVRQGLALTFTRYSRAYVAEEEQARMAKLALWSGAFIAPWDWRHHNCKTVILGATMVPIDAQAKLCGSGCSVGAPSLDCTIKGNVNRKGEHIYHLPSNLNYCNINMNKPGCRWFCSEEEAKAAGWRPASR